jgi:hypothetical protein
MFFVDPRSANAERDRAALHPALTTEALAKVGFLHSQISEGGLQSPLKFEPQK